MHLDGNLRFIVTTIIYFLNLPLNKFLDKA
jgi:hypothetical protein